MTLKNKKRKRGNYIMKKFYAIMEGTKKTKQSSFDKKSGKMEMKEVKSPVSQLFIAEGRTRIEALREAEDNAKKTGRKISYFGAFK